MLQYAHALCEPPLSNNTVTESTDKTSHSHLLGERFRSLRVLQCSLFGEVHLAYDTVLQCEVALKVSRAELTFPQSNAPAMSTVCQATSTARSRAGVQVLEDVRREARVLRVLLDSEQSDFSSEAMDAATCGLSRQLIDAINLPANAIVQPGAINPLSIQQQFINAISKGKASIANFHAEVETDLFHLLATEYASGGDLFSVLTTQPQQRVSEGVARMWLAATFTFCILRYCTAYK
jgi:serine/threonine protein kinase